MKTPTQISSLPTLCACFLSLLAPLHAADITFVGHQDAVEADADTPTSGWRNTTPAKPLDIDGNHILGTDGYEVAGVRSSPGYTWLTRTAPNYNASASWGLWDTPSNPSGNDTLAAALYHGAGADVFEIVIRGDSLAGKTLRLGILYSVIGGGSSTFSVTQTVGGNQKVTTPALSYDGTALNAAFFNITGAMEGDTFLVSRTLVSGGEGFGGITFDSAPTSPATELPEVPGTVRGTYVAPLEVSRVFSDNGVLQRGTVLPVWGWDDPGTEVTVQFAGQTVTGTADAGGRWTAELQALAANSTPRTMTVSAGAETVTIQNLLVGDVWLCSGQSNMWMNFNGSMRADMPDFIDPDSLPTIRHLKIKEGGAGFPQKRLPEGNASWTVCNSTTVIDYTAVGFFFAYFVTQETGVPIGLINCTFGNSRIGEWVSPDGINLVTDQIPASSFRGTYSPEPCQVYYGQIAPLRGYRLTGALWYQGENNGGEGDSYFWKMKALFQGWRNEWQQGDFPFYYAQLPSYDAGSWAPTREAQRRALTIINTGMATLVDVGGVGLAWPMNLHPPNKYDVGRRLAQWALANEYGQTGLVRSGPLFKSAVFSGANVTISYDHVGSGLVAAKKPSPQSIEPPAPVANLAGFELAGANNVWHPADAVIQGASVVLSSASVPTPQSARYLYAMNTDAGTLYNQENLPAAPFLTTAADNPSPPNVPTGLNAAPGDGRVDLAWNAPGGADSYEVKRGTTPGGPYSIIGSPSSTSYADTTVTNGTTYHYVVSALNTVGQSADSTEASATPQASTNPPAAPTGLAATPGNGRVDLGWNASGNADGYNVKRGTSPGGPFPAIGTTPGTSFADTTAANGTTYYYVVSASNAFGESPDSGIASATPSSGVTTISYVGDHIGIESDVNSATDGGWRSPSTAKPLDIDGDAIYGTDGYWFGGGGLKPSYVSAFTALYTNSNSAAGWAAWDNPAGTADQEYPYLRNGYTAGDPIVQFAITGTGLDGKVLRVGCYGTVFAHTQNYTITQTVGGSGVASSPVIAFSGNTMDGVFFDITGAKAGDTFVVSVSREGVDGGEGMSGITFDTAAVSATETFAGWISGFAGLAGETAFADDPDGDGIVNGIESYFGTHPGEFSLGLVIETASGSTITFTHPLNDSPASDIAARYRWSKDLSSFKADGETFEGTTVSFSQGAPSGGIVEVNATITGNPLDRLFIDIEVTQNQS